MKAIKIGCVLLLCLSIFICLCIGIHMENLTTSIHENNNAKATMGFTKLVKSFDHEGPPTEPSYPEEYGGAYINESGKYSYDELLAVNNIIGDYIRVQYDNADDLNGKVPTMIDVEVVQSAIDTRNNTVVVWLDDVSDEAIEAFRKNICDAPCITFQLAPEGRPTLDVLSS